MERKWCPAIHILLLKALFQRLVLQLPVKRLNAVCFLGGRVPGQQCHFYPVK
jgi:hypothetical protein